VRDATILLRCGNCGAVNRVPAERLGEHPKCGKCKRVLEFARTPLDVTSSHFDREILRWPGAVLVMFWAPWCGHCRTIMPVVDDMAHRRAGPLKVCRVNVDNESALSDRFQIRATPTFFLYRNGNKISDIAGALQGSQLEAWIDASLLGA
jgi:thioredoxin 2